MANKKIYTARKAELLVAFSKIRNFLHSNGTNQNGGKRLFDQLTRLEHKFDELTVDTTIH